MGQHSERNETNQRVAESTPLRGGLRSSTAGRIATTIASRYRRIWLEALGLSIASQLMTLLFPIILQVTVDRVLIRRVEGALGMLMLVLTVVAVFEGVFLVMRSQLLDHTTVRVHVELDFRVLRHVLALPLIYFDRQRMSDVIARVRELALLRRVLNGDSLGRAVDFVLTVFLTGLMVFYSPLLTAVLAGYVVVFTAVLLVTTPVFSRRMDQLSRAGAENDGLIVESLARIEAIKCTGIEGQIRSRLEASLARDGRTRMRMRTSINWITFVNNLIMRGGTLLLILVGARLVLRDELTIGEFFAFQFIILRLSLPIAFMIKSMLDMQETGLSFRKLSEIMDVAAESQPAPGSAATRIVGALNLERVEFGYSDSSDERVLHNINLRIPAGQIVAFIGPSGSGKTTLLKVALGMYRPNSGCVLIDGVDVASIDAQALRSQVGIVQQDNPLFDMSVRDNIAISDPTIPLERIQTAAMLAGAHEFITRLPDGYDTMIGSYSARLSGGERQRIAIARALVRNPRVLVFDEATSALDFETERVIQANMRSICADRTVIIVSHRLSAVLQAQRIVTLMRGSIIEDGSHDELIHANGWYASLYRLQTGLRHPDEWTGPAALARR